MPNTAIPLYQTGTVSPRDLVRYDANGLTQSAGGLDGDVFGKGVNPFSITDTAGIALNINSAATSGQYNTFGIGHDSSGNALLTLDSFGGMADKTLYFRKNGTLYEFPFSLTGVVGPGSSTVGHLVTFNNTGGSLLADSGIVAANLLSGAGSSVVGHVPAWNNTLGTVLTDPISSMATRLTNRSANYATTANYGGTATSAGLIEVLGSAGTPDSTQDSVAIFQKYSNSSTNYNLGINPAVYVSNVMKSGASTARGTALYAETQMTANAASSANFGEGIRGHTVILAGVAGGEASGMVAYAGEEVTATHAYLIGMEAEVANNSVDATYNFDLNHFETCYLATARSTKKPFAAYSLNPFTAVGSAPQVGYYVPPAFPNVQDTPCVAAFRSDGKTTWGIDLTGHGAGATFAAIGAPNNVPAIRAINAAQTQYPSLLMFDSADRMVIGNDPLITGGIHIGGSGHGVTWNEASMFAANGGVATVLGSVGPAGSHTTVQGWFVFKDSGGNNRYIPCF